MGSAKIRDRGVKLFDSYILKGTTKREAVKKVIDELIIDLFEEYNRQLRSLKDKNKSLKAKLKEIKMKSDTYKENLKGEISKNVA